MKVASPVSPAVTGERVSTSHGGFNPTWQRHVAAYGLGAPQLPPGRVLDLGCGVGHSYRALAPRETVGLDIDPVALSDQDRKTVVADMRATPFPDSSFASVLSVHSLEHVPDAEAVLREVVRVLEPEGSAVFVTPNRLTFARKEEIIDPYHFREYSPNEMERLCSPFFEEVELRGIFGSERYLGIVTAELRRLDRMLRLDPLRLRRLVPRWARQRLYDAILRRERAIPTAAAALIGSDDFTLGKSGLEGALDVVAVCRRPRQSR